MVLRYISAQSISTSCLFSSHRLRRQRKCTIGCNHSFSVVTHKIGHKWHSTDTKDKYRWYSTGKEESKVRETRVSGTEFNIIMVNDVYELVPDYKGLGGLAELSTLIKNERAHIESKHNNNPANCIVTLNGDFLSASQLAYRYEFFFCFASLE
jgi:hypothetical protein